MDITTYNKLWTRYINDQSAYTNLYNLPYVVAALEKKSMSLYTSNQISIQEFNGIIANVSKLYSSIIDQFCRDYEELPYSYKTGENYALDQVVDIMIHTIRHNIMISLNNAVSKALTLYVQQQQTNNNNYIFTTPAEYSRYITGLVSNVMDDRMFNYIIHILPEKFVKVALNVFEGDDDHDRLITKSLTLFDPILNMIQQNGTIPITNDSTVYTLLQKQLFPLFNDTLTITITESKNMIDNYIRYLRNENNQIKIVKILEDKANM